MNTPIFTLILSVITTFAIGQTPPDDADVFRELEAYADSTAIALGGCPTAIIVSRHDTVLFESYRAGVGDLAPLGPVDENSLWPLYSMTKSYGAAVLLSLVHEGLLSLDDPVVRFLPSFGASGDGSYQPGDVSVRHLASHMSGVEIPEEAWSGSDADLRLVRIIENPGSTWRYSSQGMYVLEKVIQSVAGADYEDVLRARLLVPLNLKKTRYLYDFDPDLPLLPVKPPTDEPESYYLTTKGARIETGLYATARDVNRFGQLWIGDGMFKGRRYFTAALKQEAWTYQGIRESDGNRYGLLWWLFEDEGGFVMSGAGAKASAVVPETDVVVTVLRLPLDPQPGPYSFYDDKLALVRFAKRLGL